jgi:hypothetical protein
MEFSKLLKYKRVKTLALLALTFIYLVISYPRKEDEPPVGISTIEQITELKLSAECECHKHEELILTRQRPNGPFVVYLHDLKKIKISRLYSIDWGEFQKMRFTCDLYKTLRRGPNQQIIGISLYGRQSNYFCYNQLKFIIRQVRDLYKNKWSVRIYYNRSTNKTAICQTECLRDEQSGELVNSVDFCDIDRMYENYEAYRSGKSFNADYIHAMMW